MKGNGHYNPGKVRRDVAQDENRNHLTILSGAEAKNTKHTPSAGGVKPKIELLWHGTKKDDSKKGTKRVTVSQATVTQGNAVQKAWNSANATAPSPMCCADN